MQPGRYSISRARGVVVSHPLSTREALGSIPSVSMYTDLDAALDSLLAQETSVGNQAGFASSTARPPSTPSITMYADPTAASDRDARVKTGSWQTVFSPMRPLVLLSVSAQRPLRPNLRMPGAWQQFGGQVVLIF